MVGSTGLQRPGLTSRWPRLSLMRLVRLVQETISGQNHPGQAHRAFQAVPHVSDRHIGPTFRQMQDCASRTTGHAVMMLPLHARSKPSSQSCEPGDIASTCTRLAGRQLRGPHLGPPGTCLTNSSSVSVTRSSELVWRQENSKVTLSELGLER